MSLQQLNVVCRKQLELQQVSLIIFPHLDIIILYSFLILCVCVEFTTYSTAACYSNKCALQILNVLQ